MEEEKGGKAMTNQPSTFPLPDLFREPAIHTHLFPQTPFFVSITISLIKKSFSSNKPEVSPKSGHSHIPKKEPQKTKQKPKPKKTIKVTSPHAIIYLTTMITLATYFLFLSHV